MSLGFLGVQTLETYNTTQCASFCNDLPTCGSINIYFERLPVVDPSRRYGCPDPDSTTHIKCVLWRSKLTKDDAANIGEIREDFQVVIAGSNLYNKQAGVLEVPGFNGPNNADYHATFDVPNEPVGNYSTRLSRKIFHYESSRQFWESKNNISLYGRTPQRPLKSYDVSVCANACNEWTNNSEAFPQSPSPYLGDAFSVCSMFIAYEIRRDDQPMAMVCDTFSSVWSTHYQTLRKVQDMEIAMVSVYTREDYRFPPICAIKEFCKGVEYYAGGDCSGWGSGNCQAVVHDSPTDDESPMQDSKASPVVDEEPGMDRLDISDQIPTQT